MVLHIHDVLLDKVEPYIYLEPKLAICFWTDDLFIELEIIWTFFFDRQSLIDWSVCLYHSFIYVVSSDQPGFS